MIAATNRDLEQMIADGAVPRGPLLPAERLSDQRPAAARAPRGHPDARLGLRRRILAGAGQAHRIDLERAPAALQRYPWPGNVRELRNVVERAVIVSTRPQLAIEPPARRRRRSRVRRSQLDDVEREHIRQRAREDQLAHPRRRRRGRAARAEAEHARGPHGEARTAPTRPCIIPALNLTFTDPLSVRPGGLMFATLARHRRSASAIAFATALLLPLASLSGVAQDAATKVGDASKAMGVDGLTSITFSGSATAGNFGQSTNIAGPLAVTTITNYTRAIDLAQPASRATGTTMTPALPGAPPPQPGTLNQNITPANAAWTQQLEIWITPWGFLKGAAANNATARSQRIRRQDSQRRVMDAGLRSRRRVKSYTVTGYLERSEHGRAGRDLGRAPDSRRSPCRGDVQRLPGLRRAESSRRRSCRSARVGRPSRRRSRPPARTRRTSPQLLTPPAPARVPLEVEAQVPPRPRPRRRCSRKSSPTASIASPAATGARDRDDRTTSSCSRAGRTRRAGSPSLRRRSASSRQTDRYVVNTHAHFDHASGLAPFVGGRHHDHHAR